MTECATCQGKLWVCEDHPDTPWNDGDGCCGGAGMPCPDCNSEPGLWPRHPPDFVVICSVGDWHNGFIN